MMADANAEPQSPGRNHAIKKSSESGFKTKSGGETTFFAAIAIGTLPSVDALVI
jgi:hypothetical protein